LIKWTEYLKGRFGKLRKKEKYLRDGEGKKKERKQKTKQNQYKSNVSSLSTYHMLHSFQLLIGLPDQSTLLLRNLLTSRVTGKEHLNAWHTLNRAFLFWQNLEKLY
jgi:hypothetical protein